MQPDSRQDVAPPPDLSEVTRRLRNDLGALSKALDQSRRELTDAVARFVQERPLVAIGIAAVTGYVLGGGLFSRTTSRALAVGARLGGAAFLRDLLSGSAARAVEDLE